MMKQFNEESLKSLQNRNKERLEIAKEYLGEKWVLHKSNSVKRINTVSPILQKCN